MYLSLDDDPYASASSLLQANPRPGKVLERPRYFSEPEGTRAGRGGVRLNAPRTSLISGGGGFLGVAGGAGGAESLSDIGGTTDDGLAVGLDISVWSWDRDLL